MDQHVPHSFPAFPTNSVHIVLVGYDGYVEVGLFISNDLFVDPNKIISYSNSLSKTPNLTKLQPDQYETQMLLKNNKCDLDFNQTSQSVWI